MLINLKKIALIMPYLAEIHACRWIKDPVKLYISFTASDKHALLAEDIAQNVARNLQKEHRAYLSKYAGFAGKNIVYAAENPDSGTSEHERWHNFLEKSKVNPAAGEFIEEASSYVIDDKETGKYIKHLNWSKKFVGTYLNLQKSSGKELESILEQFGDIIPEWDKEVMEGSCPWLRFIDEAKYFLLYALCHDIALGRSMKEAKNIYKTSLAITKKRGISKGINHLRRCASKAISGLYNFEFDIGGYFPNYPSVGEYRFFGNELIIEAYGKYKTWIGPLEKELMREELKQG